jgi:hypothetical protein
VGLLAGGARAAVTGTRIDDLRRIEVRLGLAELAEELAAIAQECRRGHP